METSERKHSIDVTLKKIFDMKMKQGHEMKKAHIDEVIIIYNFIVRNQMINNKNENRRIKKNIICNYMIFLIKIKKQI